jgi:hypothetical protein
MVYPLIRIKRNCQNNNLIILTDSGSTHSFIDEHVVKEIKTTIETTTVLAVIMANETVLAVTVRSRLPLKQRLY